MHLQEHSTLVLADAFSWNWLELSRGREAPEMGKWEENAINVTENTINETCVPMEGRKIPRIISEMMMMMSTHSPAGCWSLYRSVPRGANGCHGNRMLPGLVLSLTSVYFISWWTWLRTGRTRERAFKLNAVWRAWKAIWRTRSKLSG